VVMAAAPGSQGLLLYDGIRFWGWSPGSQPGELMAAETVAVWKNHILVIEPSRLRLFQWNGSELVEKSTINGAWTWLRRWGGGLRSRHMLFQRGDEYLHIDLETISTRPISLEGAPINYVDSRHGLTVVSREEDRLRINTWQGTKRRTHFWQPSMDFRVVSVFSSGIVVSNSRHFEVYRFTWIK